MMNKRQMIQRRDELEPLMAEIARGTPMKPRSALAEGYRAWCVLYERWRVLNERIARMA